VERGLYVAAAGMAAEQVRQDLVANNLANASTPGYKADRARQRDFSEVLLASRAGGGTVGLVGNGPAVLASVTDLTPAAPHDTGQPLDLAIQGEGFFAVRTANGVRYTRNGEFGKSPDGLLVDAAGDRVLGQDGGPVRVAADGTVADSAVGVFAVRDATKEGANHFTGVATGRGAGTVRTGALEASGADPVRTMVEMMASTRAYESGQRVIQTIDDTLGKAAGQVGSLGA